MDFKQYLINRHSIVKNAKKIGETSASQYNNRLINLRKRNIYNEEEKLTRDIVKNINHTYVNKTHEYERTITYYLEFKAYMNRQIKN